MIVAKARMKEKVIEHLSELELCVERIPLSELTQALIESNKSALKSSGTYRLDAMVRGLVPGIIQEEREALFEYEGEASPLTQCVMSAWRDGRRSNLMLVGEGGIGKTVAMQEVSLALCKLGIPAVYIPLHMVPYLNVGKAFVKEYVASGVLKGDRGLFKNLDELARSKSHDDRPNVVLLLDGWNEINEKKTPCGWLTDVMKEEIETELSSLEGVQVVIAGRAKMDTFGMSGRRWSSFKVLRLERKSVGKYLSNNKVALPPVDDPVWDTLGNPLMLTLYTCSARQGAHCRENTCCSFIRGERSRSQSAIIWNFLQCQINKAMLVNRERGAAFSDLLAINYAAAYIGWSMERSGDVIANAALVMDAGCALVSIEDRVDTSADEAFASHITALSKASSDIRSRRVRAGMAKAAGEGKKAGRPKVDSGALREAVEMYENGGFGVREILDATGVSRATLYHRTVLYGARPKQARTVARSEKPMGAKNRSSVADRVRADIGDGDFADVGELDVAILERAEHYNAQPCGGPSRDDLFWEQEAAMLLALPSERYGFPEWLRRVAGGDYHVKVCGFRYSVPWGYAGQRVNVRVSGEAVEVWSGGAMIARHARVTEQAGRNTVTDPAHRPPSHAAFAKRMETRFMAMAAPKGKWAAKAMKLVLRQCGKGGAGFRACKELLDLADAPSGVTLDDACRSVLQGEGAFSVDAVRELMGAGT